MGFTNGGAFGFFVGSEPSTGGTVTSTFTTGYVPYATSATNLGNSGMFYDAATTAFGINTITPATVLNILTSETADVRGVSLQQYNDTTAATGAKFIGTRARGVVATPTAVLLDDALVAFQGRGYKATGFSATVGGIAIHAAANWTDVATLTYLTVSGVTSGTTVAEWARFVGGNFLVNTTTNAGFRMDVSGTARVSGVMTVNNTISFANTTLGIQLVDGTAYNSSFIVGNTNTGFPTVGTRHQIIGNNNTLNNNATCVIAHGWGNNISATNNFTIAIGAFNVASAASVGGVENNILIGQSNSITVVAGKTVVTFAIGIANVVAHDHCMVMGSNITTTADNQLIIAQTQSNINDAGYNDIYFGTGPRSGELAKLGSNIVINGSGAGVGTDLTGGSVTIAAGKSTGNALAPDLMFATATAGATGTTLQTLSTRWYIKGETGYLSTRTGATEMFDINGNILLNTAGNKIKIKTGANASTGTATLVGGTVTVNTTAAVTASNIFLSVRTIGGTPGTLSYTVTNGTDFTITSSSGTDTSTIDWIIIDGV